MPSSCVQSQKRVNGCKTIIDSNLSLNDHVKKICKKVSQKLCPISRMTDIISTEKRTTLLSVFFNSQFSHCPLIWMFCSRSLNNRINRLHERSLRMAYDDYTSSFEQLLEKDETTNIHQQNLRTLATEMYKVSKNLSPPFIRELFTQKEVTYNTRYNVSIDVNDNDKTHCTKKMNFKIPKANTTHFGLAKHKKNGPNYLEFCPRRCEKR